MRRATWDEGDRCLYTFVGARRVVNTHLRRSLLLLGMTQSNSSSQMWRGLLIKKPRLDQDCFHISYLEVSILRPVNL